MAVSLAEGSGRGLRARDAKSEIRTFDPPSRLGRWLHILINAGRGTAGGEGEGQGRGGETALERRTRARVVKRRDARDGGGRLPAREVRGNGGGREGGLDCLRGESREALRADV